jgi:hypothetical protein
VADASGNEPEQLEWRGPIGAASNLLQVLLPLLLVLLVLPAPPAARLASQAAGHAVLQPPLG